MTRHSEKQGVETLSPIREPTLPARQESRRAQRVVCREAADYDDQPAWPINTSLLDIAMRVERFPTNSGSMSSDVTDDLWLVYRIADRQFECALWQLRDGEWALSLFLSQEKAERYRVEFSLADWHSRNLPRADLLEVIRACRASGVKFAVLDPDRQQARVIFDLSAVLRQVGFDNESRPS